MVIDKIKDKGGHYNHPFPNTKLSYRKPTKLSELPIC